FASSGGFSVMWAHDGSRRDVPDWDFVAYPAPGFFPAGHLASGAAWHVSVNERKFRKPRAASDVKVTVTPALIDLRKGEVRPAGPHIPINHLSVNTGGYGIGNAIIFRPARLAESDGMAYRVEIAGLKDAQGDGATIRYVVEFFRE